jgi:DNA-binding XRE family transcriptional regulator
MALIDHYAAQRLRDMREERGLSPETLAAEIREHIKSQGWGSRGAVDPHTIRRIERRGHVPGPRIAFVIANYFELRPNELWLPANRRVEQAA